MSARTWEDRINPAACGDVIAQRDAAYREQRAAIEAIRSTIDDVPKTARRYTRPVAPKPKTVPVPEPKPVNMDHHWPPSRVLRLRKSLRMTQQELADVLRVSKNTVSRWELGDRSPSHGSVKGELLALEQRVKEAV